MDTYECISNRENYLARGCLRNVSSSRATVPIDPRNRLLFPQPGIIHDLRSPGFNNRTQSLINDQPSPPKQSKYSGDDHCWQTDAENWKGQLHYLLQNSKWTDCTVYLKDEEDHIIEEVKCHKMMLAKSSPVFEKLFFGPMADNTGSIHVSGITPPVFKAFLKFIYTGDLDDGLTIQEVGCLLCCADMYLMTHLRTFCVNRMIRRLNHHNVDFLYHFSDLHGIERLANAASNHLEYDTSFILNKTPILLSLSRETLLAIVKMDHLNISSEANLIHHVYRWAENQVKTNDLEVNTTNIRSALGPIFTNLRFLTLDKKEFLDVVDNNCMLNSQEKYDLLKYIVTIGGKSGSDFDHSYSKLTNCRERHRSNARAILTLLVPEPHCDLRRLAWE